MNWKAYSVIQRQLGYVEGLTMGVKEEIGADLTEAVNVLSDMIEEHMPKEGRCVEQETGNGF